jgi:hypothetical protein
MPEWESRPEIAQKAALLGERYVRYWARICCDPKVDGVDGTGVTPVVPGSMLALALVGAGLGLARRRRALVVFGLLVVALMPMASVMTNGSEARRTLALAPFIAMFAALALAELFQLTRSRSRPVRVAVALGLALMASVVIYENVDNYFSKFPASSSDGWVFSRELTEAATYMRTLPPGSHVYFYSERWSVNYEPRKFLAPNVSAEDRSTEHNREAGGSLLADVSKGSPVYVLMGRYRERLEELRRLYPAGSVTVRGDPKDPDFVVLRAVP